MCCLINLNDLFTSFNLLISTIDFTLPRLEGGSCVDSIVICKNWYVKTSIVKICSVRDHWGIRNESSVIESEDKFKVNNKST